MRSVRTQVYLALTVLGSSAASQKSAVSETSQQAETLRHFRALVQIDTSNPPGNEIRIVEYLEKVLAADGIPSTRFALDPNRAEPRSPPRRGTARSARC